MKLEDVRGIARACGIKPDNLFKTELIKMIQLREGNFDCYASASAGECDQRGCLWRKDCFEIATHK